MRPSNYALARVAVVRQSGMQTYEELIDEFRGQVRAAVRVVGADLAEQQELRAWLRSYRPRVILAVGQSAYDLVRTARMPVVSALALRRPWRARDAAVSLAVPTTSVLAAFHAAHPHINRIGALHGPRALPLMAGAQAEARLLGIELLAVEASSPEEAISRLRGLSHQVQGLWLVPDLDLLSPQVLQYALMLQFRRRLPLLGATRRHTMQGALFALDHDPEDLGRQAALLANHLLAGRRLTLQCGEGPIGVEGSRGAAHTDTGGRGSRSEKRGKGSRSEKRGKDRRQAAVPCLPPIPARLSLNLTTAQRIGIDSLDLRRSADRVYQ